MSAILVTGGCGYIGSHVVYALAQRGINTVVIDNLSTGTPTALLHKERLYTEDCGNTEALKKILSTQKFAAVIHFAAAIAVEESVHDPYKYYYNNTFNTMKLIKTCSDFGVNNFIFSSTAAVYGTPKTVPVNESAPIQPESPYGHSKAMSEQILRDMSLISSLKFVILRYFNVAGAHPENHLGQRSKISTHLIKIAAEVAVGKRPSMTIYGTDYPTHDGTCIRDYIHVQDLAIGHLDALDYLQKGGPSVELNCGYGRGYSVKEVIQAIEQVIGKPLAYNVGPRRAGDAVQVVADCTKINQLLQWRPKYTDIHTIVRHAWQWEQRLTKES